LSPIVEFNYPPGGGGRCKDHSSHRAAVNPANFQTKVNTGDAVEPVVDPQLPVLGLEGLRVVDASVMPEEPGDNTNVPTIMIAEKASDLLRNRQLVPADVSLHSAASVSSGCGVMR
jgi:hypothetical protein